jgi:hypothetical protein
MRQIVGGLVNNEFEKCGRTLSLLNVKCQKGVRRITKICGHDDRAAGRDTNSKLAKLSTKNAGHF